MIAAHPEDCGRAVVHPDWLGKVATGEIVAVPNTWHADVQTSFGRMRMAQASLVWAEDWKK